MRPITSKFVKSLNEICDPDDILFKLSLVERGDCYIAVWMDPNRGCNVCIAILIEK